MLCVGKCHHPGGWTQTIADQENTRALWTLNSQVPQQFSSFALKWKALGSIPSLGSTFRLTHQKWVFNT